MSYKCVAGISVELFKNNSGVSGVQPVTYCRKKIQAPQSCVYEHKSYMMELRGFDSGLFEDSRLLGCNAVWLGDWLPDLEPLNVKTTNSIKTPGPTLPAT
jgi:hypothetical protein